MCDAWHGQVLSPLLVHVGFAMRAPASKEKSRIKLCTSLFRGSSIPSLDSPVQGAVVAPPEQMITVTEQAEPAPSDLAGLKKQPATTVERAQV